MLVPKFVEKKDELQNNHQRKLRKSRNENIFTLFQSPREKVLSEDNSYRGRYKIKKFVPKYIQQQQQEQRARHQNHHHKHFVRFKHTDSYEDIQNEEGDDDNDYDDGDNESIDDGDCNSDNPSGCKYTTDEWDTGKKKPISPSHYHEDIKNIITYRNTSESCIFYLRFGSRRLIGPFIFHPQINPEQNQFTDIFLQTGKINAFNPKDLLYMRNRREIPVSKVQITDQILDAAYDLERYILDQTKRSQYSMNRPFVDHNLTQIINDLIGNTQFTITATPVVQNELFVKNSGENYKQQMNNLYRILDSLREQVSELKEENRSLHAQLEVYTNCKNNERHCIERNNERMNESTFAWHARLNALLDQYRAENEALKSHNYSLTQSQQTLFRDQEYMQQQNTILKQEVDELKRSQNLILARSESAIREERERMNREQEELHRELANVKKKLAQSPTQCPLHPTGQRTHFKNPYNEDYRVNECPKYSLHNRRDQDFSPSNPEQTRVKRVRICSGQHSSRLPRLNIPGQTVNIPIKKIKKPEIQVSNIPRSTAYAKQHTNKQTTNNKSHTVTNMSK